MGIKKIPKIVLISLGIIAVLILPKISRAAIAFDGNTASANCAGCSSLTFSHTVTSNTNGILIVYIYDNGGDNVTGVTYAGTSMGQVGKISGGAGVEIYTYSLLVPNTGANNVVVTASGSQTTLVAGADSYTGVSGIGATTTCTTASNTAFSCTLTTNNANSWIAMGLREDNGQSISAGAGTTLRYNAANGFGLGEADSNAALSAGVNALNVSGAAATNWYTVIEELNAAAGGGGGGGGASSTPGKVNFIFPTDGMIDVNPIFKNWKVDFNLGTSTGINLTHPGTLRIKYAIHPDFTPAAILTDKLIYTTSSIETLVPNTFNFGATTTWWAQIFVYSPPTATTTETDNLVDDTGRNDWASVYTGAGANQGVFYTGCNPNSSCFPPYSSTKVNFNSVGKIVDIKPDFFYSDGSAGAGYLSIYDQADLGTLLGTTTIANATAPGSIATFTFHTPVQVQIDHFYKLILTKTSGDASIFIGSSPAATFDQVIGADVGTLVASSSVIGFFTNIANIGNGTNLMAYQTCPSVTDITSATQWVGCNINNLVATTINFFLNLPDNISAGLTASYSGLTDLAQQIFPLNLIIAVNNDIQQAQVNTTPYEIVLSSSTNNIVFQGRSMPILTSSTLNWIKEKAGFDYRAFIDALIYFITAFIILELSVKLLRKAHHTTHGVQ